MEKTKSFKLSNILGIIKCCLLAILVTLVGIVILAIVLKFTDLSSNLIGYINNAIKLIAIFIMMQCIKKQGEEKLILKAIFAGVLYSVVSFVIFSILNGTFALNAALLYDVAFAVLSAVLVSIIINIFKRKTI